MLEEKNYVIKIANFYSLLLLMLQQSVKQQLAEMTIGQMSMGTKEIHGIDARAKKA
jgi:hypothetical protein